jgi:xanthine dehydrogenase accessory factor
VVGRDLARRAQELGAARIPFVHARVVLAERPTSAKPGDEAIILGDGTIEGFVGGSCTETTVRNESVALLGSGESVVLRITPVAERPQAGKRVIHNPCLSGGTLEVFLEPSVPPPLVVVVGDAPIANALASLGAALRYSVEPFAGALPPDTAAVVVASHGRGEEQALGAALEAEVPYIALVASTRRGSAVLDGLNLTAEQQGRIHTPAGLDIGAVTAEEISLSILAQIVATRVRSPVSRAPSAEGIPVAVPAGPTTDPVCGMSVQPGEGLRLDHGGRTVWFCGRGCLEAFAADPALYPTSP